MLGVEDNTKSGHEKLSEELLNDYDGVGGDDKDDEDEDEDEKEKNSGTGKHLLHHIIPF